MWLERRMLGNMMLIMKHVGCRDQLLYTTFTPPFAEAFQRAEAIGVQGTPEVGCAEGGTGRVARSRVNT